jgi:hypothetical protein
MTTPAGTWRKASHSLNAGACVEVGTTWRKASHSMNNGACVEAGCGQGAVAIRDTTDRTGPQLDFPVVAWTAFTATFRMR